MKEKTKIVLAFLLMLLLFASAICIGAYRGWKSEYEKGHAALQTLDEILVVRKELAYNIAVVAERHGIPKEETAALLSHADALLSSDTLAQKASANAALGEISKKLIQELSDSESVRSDDRDSMYVRELFPQILKNSESWADGSHYENYVKNYNKTLQKSLSGRLAQAFGIKMLESYSPKGDGK